VRRGDLLWWISYIGQVLVRGLNDVGWSGVTAPSSIKAVCLWSGSLLYKCVVGKLNYVDTRRKGR